jgi:hypothetical protein
MDDLENALKVITNEKNDIDNWQNESCAAGKSIRFIYKVLLMELNAKVFQPFKKSIHFAELLKFIATAQIQF